MSGTFNWAFSPRNQEQRQSDEEGDSGAGVPTDDRQVEDPHLVATHDPTTQRHVQGISRQQQETEHQQLINSIVYPSHQANRSESPQKIPSLVHDPDLPEDWGAALAKHQAAPSPLVATQESRAPPPPLSTKRLDETAEEDDGTDDRFSDVQQRDDQSGCKYSSGTNDGHTRPMNPTPSAAQDNQSLTNGEGSVFAQNEDGEWTEPEGDGAQQANQHDDDDDDAPPQ